jgi:NmrA-like family
MGILEQIKMIDAAAEAGVKRFMPSEFGADRRKGIHPDFAVLQQGKIQVFDHMIKKSQENRDLTWTSLATGPLLDWVSAINILLSGSRSTAD